MVVLGIDIGGHQIRSGMVDASGAILASRSISTPADLDAFVPAMQEAVRWLLEASGIPAGVGVGCKGVIDPDTTRIESLRGTLHYLEGLRLADLIELPVEVPIFADNDARVALAGEMVWGAAKGRSHVLMVTLGNGVGGAALVNGQLLRGHSGTAGQVGHITVDPHGAICSCGNRGCLETVFSARAIEAEAMAAVRRGCDSMLTRLFREQPQLASCRTIFQAASEGDELACTIVSDAVYRLAGGLAGLLHIFDPEVLIVGGYIADAGDALFNPLREAVRLRTRFSLGREVPIVEQEVSDKSGVVSAAGLVLAPR
ncbi:MAG TPA: ROK family protein [Candidatus Solibacter sp.]|nr:ROK family protein [Candidatus Solibacter sp.]